MEVLHCCKRAASWMPSIPRPRSTSSLLQPVPSWKGPTWIQICLWLWGSCRYQGLPGEDQCLGIKLHFFQGCTSACKEFLPGQLPDLPCGAGGHPHTLSPVGPGLPLVNPQQHQAFLCVAPATLNPGHHDTLCVTPLHLLITYYVLSAMLGA